MIIVLVGPSCAGKTTAGEYVASVTGSPLFEASDYVHDLYKRSAHDGTVMEFVQALFKSEGYGIIARRLSEELSASGDGTLAVVAGFRTVEEVEVLRETFADVRVVGIHADASVRYDRCVQRNRQGDPRGYREFLRKDFTEYRLGIAELMSETAELVVLNNDSIDEFQTRLAEQVLPEAKP